MTGGGSGERRGGHAVGIGTRRGGDEEERSARGMARDARGTG